MKHNLSIMILLPLLLVLSAGPSIGASTASMRADEPTGGQWATILSGGLVILDPPLDPGSKLAASEIEELKHFQSKRTPAIIKTIEYWNDSATVRWNEIARDLVIKHKTDPPMASRVYALLSVAQYDALISAWDNKYRYSRTSPDQVDPSIYPMVVTTKDPAYPSEHAVVASASAEVLKYLYPDEASYLDGKAKEDEESRLWGKVMAWLINDPTQLRPVAPPEYDSAEFKQALSEIRSISDHRTEKQIRIAERWVDDAGTATPPGHWNQIACQMIGRYHLNELRSARTLALMNMAMMDAGFCCWDTKFHYCMRRPWLVDPKITTAVPKPNFPSYTSGHSAFSSAGSEVLGYIFPREKSTLESMAEEAGISRLYGGIHYRFDMDKGAEVGHRIAQLAIRRGMEDGSRHR